MDNFNQLEINSNFLSMKPSATLRINQKAKAAKASGKNVCHLGFGESPFPVPEKVQHALKNNSHQHSYLPSKGLLELRTAIADYQKKHFGYNFKPENIVVGPGSKQLLFQLLTILEGEVMVPSPSWVSYKPILQMKGKKVHEIGTTLANSYKLAAESLDKKCKELGPKQKLLIMNSPSNPTGAIYTDKEVEAIAQVARKNSVIIISDEIYALINYSGKEYTGFSKYYPEGTVVTNGLSKSHHMGGYRVGYAAVPESMLPLVDALEAMTDASYSSVSAPIQYAAIAAFTIDTKADKNFVLCNRLHEATSKYVYKRLIEMGIECPKPEGAYYLFPSFAPFAQKLKNRGITTSTELAARLFDDELVVVLPGTDFHCPESQLNVRITTVDYNGDKVLELAQKLTGEISEKFITDNCPNLVIALDRVRDFLNKL